MGDSAPKTGPLRWILLVIGWICVALGALGAVLPVLPTAPFLLVAAACFVRSSPRFYRWLLANPVFGPFIERWRKTRTIPIRAKVTAIAMIVLVGGSSVAFFVPVLWVKIVLAAIMLSVIVWLVRVPCSPPAETASGTDRSSSSSARA